MTTKLPRPSKPSGPRIGGYVQTTDEEGKKVRVFLRKPTAIPAIRWYKTSSELYDIGEIEFGEIEFIDKGASEFSIVASSGLRKTFYCITKGEEKSNPEDWINAISIWKKYHIDLIEWQKYENERLIKLQEMEEQQRRAEERRQLALQEEKRKKEAEEKHKQMLKEWVHNHPKPKQPETMLRGHLKTKDELKKKKVEVFLRKPKNEPVLKWFPSETDIHELGEVDLDGLEVDTEKEAFTLKSTSGLKRTFACLKKGEHKTTPDFWIKAIQSWQDYYKEIDKWTEEYNKLAKKKDL